MTKQNDMSFREQMKGFPLRQMFIVCLIRFSEPLAFTSMFPYVYFMIRDFHIAKNKQDISKYSGYLASSFAFFQFLFCVRWGRFSDRVGRKWILLNGLCGTSISLLIFGFSKNYYMALFARCLQGTLNGNVAVLRTMIGEIATERRHQAIAFSTLPLLFNFGSVIGPLIGGSTLFTRPKSDGDYNSQPAAAEGFASFYDAFVDKHPYAMSNIVVACFLWFSMICGILFLEETHEKYKYRRDYGVELGDWLLSKVGVEPRQRPWQQSHLALSKSQQDEEIASIDENTPLIDDLDDSEVASLDSNAIFEEHSDNENSSVRSVKPFLSRSMSQAIVKTYSRSDSTVTKPKSSGPFTVRVVTVMISNIIVSLHSIGYNEFLPVFLASTFEPEKLKFPFKIGGGFGWDSGYIGTLFSSTGIMGMLIILIIFPLIDRKLGTINGYRLSLSIFPILYFLVPLAIFTKHDYNPVFSENFTPILLYVFTSLKTLATATGLPQIMLLIHRSAAKKDRAYVNSSAMSFTAFARFTGPIIFGYLMSFGDRHGINWLIWWVMAALSTFGFVQSYWMRDYDEDEGEEPQEEEDHQHDQLKDNDSHTASSSSMFNQNSAVTEESSPK